MAAIDLTTVPDVKSYAPKQGAGRDAALALFITAASRWIEDEIGRRLRYRAPAEVEGAANTVAARTLANETIPGGSITQPNSAGRTLIVTLTGFTYLSTTGLVTVTGTVNGVAGVTETFSFPSGGYEQHGLKFFTAISSIVVSGVASTGSLTIGTSIGYIEYHTPRCDEPCELALLEWPIGQILEVNEDPSRTFGTTSRLTLGTGYIVDHRKDGDYLVRVSSSLPIPWLSGWRSEKLVLSAGYKMTTVPGEAKDVCRRLVLLLEDEVSKGRLGIQTLNDALGNFTRFGPSMLTQDMREALSSLRRFRFGSDTGQADYDLEAA